MKIINVFAIGLAAAVFVLPCATFAQDDQVPRYASVDCMKSTSTDYVDVETDIWLPMHQARVDQGTIAAWALYWVQYGDRTKCDYYTVTTYIGSEQLNADHSVDDVFGAVHPGRNLETEMANTAESRTHVATYLWHSIDRTAVGEHRYAVVNMMNARDPDIYERMETQVFKPGHQALVDSGHRSGWAMYELVTPLGTSIPYNYSTVDFTNDLNPVPMAEALMSANPDRDLDALEDLLRLRDQVSSETWALVAATTAVAEGDEEE
jgi:hypothetical protein